MTRTAVEPRPEAQPTSRLAALISQRIEASFAVKHRLMEHTDLYAQVAHVLVTAVQSGHQLVLFGNGGSAADAQHIAAEFIGRCYLDRAPLPVQALTANTSAVTAIANDYGFDQVFSRQVEAFGRPGDVAIGISTSGNSRNIIEGLRAAKRRGMITIAMTGETGGKLKAEADYCISIPSSDTPRIQEAHIFLGHVLSEVVEHALFGGPHGDD